VSWDGAEWDGVKGARIERMNKYRVTFEKTCGGWDGPSEPSAISLPANYYNLTRLQRRAVREEYARRQEGLCFHCGDPLSGPPSAEVRKLRINQRLFPPNHFLWPVHLHHSHDTGITIGAVHCRCNAALWQYHGE
jgi:hypothetical protein